MRIEVPSPSRALTNLAIVGMYGGGAATAASFAVHGRTAAVVALGASSWFVFSVALGRRYE